MVIAVSRLAFWVESARVGVERVVRFRQRSSILCGTPRKAPCVLGANRGLRLGCSLRISKKTRDEKLHGITFSKPSDTRTLESERTWSDGEREKGAFSEDSVLRWNPTWRCCEVRPIWINFSASPPTSPPVSWAVRRTGSPTLTDFLLWISLCPGGCFSSAQDLFVALWKPKWHLQQQKSPLEI